MQWLPVIPVQTFDNGSGVFQPRGKYVKITNKVFMKELGSQKSIEITGATTSSQIQTDETYLVGTYSQLRVGFWYQSLSTATGDSFSVQISMDNGQSWSTVRQYSRNSNNVWNSDSVWYNGSTEFAKPAGAQRISLRIVAAIMSSGALYLENVSLDGR
jgi:hypothetical protein